MKKILIAIVAVFTLGLALPASAQKIVHVDYDAVMDTLLTFKKAQQLMADYETTAQESAEFLQNEIQKKYQEYEAGQSQGTMSEMQITILEDAINNLQGRLQEVQVGYQNNVRIIQERYIDKILGWFEEAVEIVGKQKGVDYIIYKSKDAPIFWVNPDGKGVDVTNAIITEMLRLEAANPVKGPGE